jgi:hypothetical protein
MANEIKPARHRHAYQDYEIAWIVTLWKLYDGKIPRRVQLWCATELERTDEAIDWVLSQLKQGKVIGNDPSKAHNAIQAQIMKARRKLGDGFLTCMYCGLTPGVWHLRCSKCDTVACLQCVITDSPIDWLCEDCGE